MRMPQFFIDRPIFASVLSLFITIMGVISYTRLPISEFPEIAPPSVLVSTSFPGASAETVADTVAAVLEQEMNGVEGMLYMYSQSTSDGSVQLRITFDFGLDLDKAQVLVQNRVAAAERRLPEEVRRQGLVVRKVSPDFLLSIHLFSDDGSYDQTYASNYAIINVMDELARVEGVGQVLIFGAREYSMRVWLDPNRIASLGLTAEQVLGALREQNVQVAGGQIGEPPRAAGDFQMPLQLKGRLRNASEFDEIIVKVGADGRTVRLKDIGRTELGALSYGNTSFKDRFQAPVIVLTQTPGTDALKAATAIKAKMAEISKRFPPGLKYDIIYNPTEFIEVSARELNKTILEAIALVVLVMLVFLQTWRATVIPLIAIPISLIGTYTVMLAAGFSLNSLTMFGLVLAVGIVVDDAIVVVENVERKLREGLSPLEAARVTMNEVGNALVAVALVLVAVFIPAAFIGGITGQFFRQFAITVSTATVISAFVSLTLSPALCAILFKPHEDQSETNRSLGGMIMRPLHAFFSLFNRMFDALSAWYAGLVASNSRRIVPLLLLYVGLVALAIFMVARTPAGFIPQLDRGILFVSIQLPAGASLARTEAVMARAREITQATPGVKHTSSFSGRNAATFTPATNAAAIFTVLDDHQLRAGKGQSVEAVAADLRRRLQAIEEAQLFVFIPPPVRGVGGQGGFAMRLQDRVGLGSEQMARISAELIGAANRNPMLRNVFTTFQTATPQVYVDVDRDKAQMLKVPLANVFEAMRIYMGSAYVNDFNMFGRTYRVITQADGAFRLTPANVADIRVRSSEGAMVPLGSLVTFRNIVGPDRVPRYNMFPTVEISGQPAAGVSSGQALDLMHEIAARTLPDGVTYEWTDLSYQERKASRTGYWIFVLSIVFVFLALAALYESWTLPLAIVLIVPMCLISATAGVRLHVQDINILTQIGFVVLIGLAAKNAILIVEFARQQEDLGLDRVAAAVSACRMRLRPILMTSLTFILGVVPLYTATGAGAEMRVSLGTAMFWGMIGVTLFGLVFTPVFYMAIRAMSARFDRRRRADGGLAPHAAE